MIPDKLMAWNISVALYFLSVSRCGWAQIFGGAASEQQSLIPWTSIVADTFASLRTVKRFFCHYFRIIAQNRHYTSSCDSLIFQWLTDSVGSIWKTEQFKQIDNSPEGTSDWMALRGCCTCVCCNELFVTVCIYDINTDSNNYYSVTVKYSI